METGTSAQIAHILIVALVAGTLGQVLSGIFRLPSIIFLLIIGIVIGPDGFNLINPEGLGKGLEIIVRLSVAFILFEGGMALQLHEVKKVQKSVRKLITLGVLFTFVTASAAAHFIAGLEFRYAILFGSLVTVTGPTVIRPLVQRVKMRPEIAAVMEGEGILADPIGAILAAVCLEYAVSAGAAGDSSALHHLQEFCVRIGAGVGVGAAAGLAAGWIVKIHMPSVERIKPLVVMACALGCYGVAEMIRHEAGIMAVVAAGIAIQRGIPSYDRNLREFKELITMVLLSVLFILLAANLRKEQMLGVGVEGLLAVLVLMLVIRPLNIFLCTWGGTPTFREKIFLSWVAPRGIVAAAVASLGALVLTRGGHEGAREFESLVFLVILMTVFLQGGTAKTVADLLGITVKEPRSVLILGANSIAREVGRIYKATGKDVTLIDRNPVLIDKAHREDFRALVGDGTDREILHLAGIDTADIFIALTGRSGVNQVTAQLALHERELEHVWIALEESERTKLDPALVRSGARLAFGRAVAFDEWSFLLGRHKARVLEVGVTAENAPKHPIGQVRFDSGVLPIVWRRNGRTEVVLDSTKLQAGDLLTLLTQIPDDEAVKKTLGVLPEAKASG